MYLLANFILLFAFEQVLVIMHESGHALTARLMRFRVFSVWIGYGKRLGSTKVFGIPVLFHALPFGGHTQAMPQSRSWVRLRYWIFAAAGPAVHVVLLIAVFSLYPDLLDIRRLIRSYFHEIAPLETFILGNVLLFATNVLPRKVKNPLGAVRTDGYTLLTVPFWKASMLEELEAALPRLEAHDLLSRGEMARAREIYEAELQKTPDNRLLLHDMAVASLHDGDFQHAYDLFLGLLDAPEFERPEIRAALLNNLAWTAAVLWRDDVLENADRFSLEAFNFNPGHLLFKGTRGTVLVRLGRYREGIQMLKEVYKLQSQPEARAAEACFIAIGFAGLDNGTEATRWLRKARGEAPGYPLIREAEERIHRMMSPDEKPDAFV